MPTKRVLEKTPFAEMAPLFWSTVCVVSGGELTSVKKLMKELAQPTFAVVGAKVENKLMTPLQLEGAAKLPSLDACRANLVATMSPASQLQRLTGMLMQPVGDLHGALGRSQGDLVGALERHASPEPVDDSAPEKDA